MPPISPEKHADADILVSSYTTPDVTLYQLDTKSREALFIGYWSKGESHCGLVIGGGYGDYTFQWFGTGEKDPRIFLKKISTDYLYSKIGPTGGIYDPDKTLLTVRRTIVQLRKGEIEVEGGPFSRAKARATWFNIEDHERLDTHQDFILWTHDPENPLPEPWRFACYGPDPLCDRFCRNIFPQFQAILTKELERDGTHQAQPTVP